MAFRKLLTLTLLATSLATHAQSAIEKDPAPNKQSPAALETFQLPSHGALLNALVYVAAGAAPHPTVILLHGFPGNEKNLDIAQTLRRAGYDVLYFDYRGSWGTPGDFSFTHAIEDTDAALAYLRNPAHATRLRVDPNNLILIGHSMGGMITAIVAAHDPEVRAAALISAANMAGRISVGLPPQARPAIIKGVAKALAAEGMAPLAGCTPESLAEDLMANAAAWNIPTLAPRLATRPILIVSSDDGNTASADALAGNLETAGAEDVIETHMATDHSYSDHRIALQQAILNFLAHLPTALPIK